MDERTQSTERDFLKLFLKLFFKLVNHTKKYIYKIKINQIMPRPKGSRDKKSRCLPTMRRYNGKCTRISVIRREKLNNPGKPGRPKGSRDKKPRCLPTMRRYRGKCTRISEIPKFPRAKRRASPPRQASPPQLRRSKRHVNSKRQASPPRHVSPSQLRRSTRRPKPNSRYNV
jgi:hypothetical protein